MNSKCSCKTPSYNRHYRYISENNYVDDSDDKHADFAKSEEAFDAEIEGVLFALLGYEIGGVPHTHT